MRPLLYRRQITTALMLLIAAWAFMAFTARALGAALTANCVIVDGGTTCALSPPKKAPLLTADEARRLTGKKGNNPLIADCEKRIRDTAKGGSTEIRCEGQCKDLMALKVRGFVLKSNGCAPFEYGGRCSCQLHWD